MRPASLGFPRRVNRPAQAAGRLERLVRNPVRALATRFRGKPNAALLELVDQNS
jgi:hypothetical protein